MHKRLLTTALVALLFAGGARGLPDQSGSTRLPHLHAVAVTSANHRSGPCREVRWASRKNYAAVDELIACASARWGPDGGYEKAVAVARCESGLFWASHTEGTRFYGVYQIGDTEWQGWVRPNHWNDWWGGAEPGPFNARANVVLALFHESRIGSWTPTWSCG